MDKEKRIAELDFVIRKAEIEKAYHLGANLVFSEIGEDVYKDYDGSHGNFAWGFYDYKIKEEPRRIPFDGSDAFNLTLKKFKHINDSFNESVVCVMATNEGVRLGDIQLSYLELSVYWLKWNDTLEVFEPCNKVA